MWMDRSIVLIMVLCIMLSFNSEGNHGIVINCLDNGVALTPAMGWNTWNHYGCNINETVIVQNAQLLISLGLAQKGYKYVNLDDCWQITRDPRTQEIVQDKSKFPSGMAFLGKYLHSRNLLFGVYSDAGTKTCQGRPGSYGYQKQDAKKYAQWGVDYLKYDNCHNEGISAKIRYPIMRNALNQSGRHIYYSMCNWGNQKPWLWAQNVGNSWRTTVDIKDDWVSVMLNFQLQENLYPYAKPGAWNDPDMLEIGNGRLTNDQQQSHFVLWAMLKAPLLIGCSLKGISKQSLGILSNQEVIQINQDPLGKQGRLFQRDKNGLFGNKQIWYAQLSRMRVAIILFNKSQKQGDFSVDLKQIQRLFGEHSQQAFKGAQIYRLRDIIKRQDIAIPTDFHLKANNVRKHATEAFIVEFINKPEESWEAESNIRKAIQIQ